jgi:hypothetical protein
MEIFVGINIFKNYDLQRYFSEIFPVFPSSLQIKLRPDCNEI